MAYQEIRTLTLGERFKAVPFRVISLFVGVLTLLHVLFYAFTGLAFAPQIGTGNSEVFRGMILIALHIVGLILGIVGLACWNDRIND